MRQVRTFYVSEGSRYGGANNFGDELVVPILRSLFDIEPILTSESRAELISVGSIIDRFQRRIGNDSLQWWRKRPWRHLHVWGSGFMASDSVALWPQSLVYCAVRGPLSASRVSPPAPANLALGDPAILLPLMWPRRGATMAEVGVVPHFATLRMFREKYESNLPHSWRIIDLLKSPQEVAMEIANCEFIISSSLHGLIVADAYNVPSLWMLPEVPIKGDGFKFSDCFAFRGVDIPGPVRFETFREQPSLYLNSNVCTARSATSFTTEQLIAAFPFR